MSQKVSLPAFSSPIEGVVGEVRSQQSCPYVLFLNEKNRLYAQIIQSVPGVQLGEAVLVQPPPKSMLRLSPFQYFLLAARQYWGRFDTTGVALEKKTQMIGTAPIGWSEVWEVAMLAFAPDGLVPALCTFKNTRCPGIYPAIAAYKEAGTDAWAKKGQAYEISARLEKPWARFVTTATVVTRPNRAKGTTYPSLHAIVCPTSAVHASLLAKFFSAGAPGLEAASVAYMERTKDLI